MYTDCINAITVYGASSRRINPAYLDAARELGRQIARAGRTLVCGGGQTGVMGAAIDGAIECGGTAVGVLPRFMVERGWEHPALSKMIVAEDMHSRKLTMASLASAAVACPGGVGTFEELMEIITWRKLGLWSGNVVILNTGGYYAPLLDMLDKAIREDFMHPDDIHLWHVAATPAEALRLATLPTEPVREFTPKS